MRMVAHRSPGRNTEDLVTGPSIDEIKEGNASPSLSARIWEGSSGGQRRDVVAGTSQMGGGRGHCTCSAHGRPFPMPLPPPLPRGGGGLRSVQKRNQWKNGNGGHWETMPLDCVVCIRDDGEPTHGCSCRKTQGPEGHVELPRRKM